MKTRGLLPALLAATAVLAVVLPLKVGDEASLQADVDRMIQAETHLTKANIRSL